jgi:hypothetical protein
MHYHCRKEDGKHFAVVENERGEVVSVSPVCDSKFHAMRVRDLARNEGAAVPKGWLQMVVRLPSVTPHPLDHDGDGRLGGSLPKSKRKPKADAAPKTDSKE